MSEGSKIPEDVLRGKLQSIWDRVFPPKDFSGVLRCGVGEIAEIPYPAPGQSCFLCSAVLEGVAIESALADMCKNLGETRKGLAEELLKKGSWELAWIVPRSVVSERTENPDFTDVHGTRWISLLRILPPGRDFGAETEGGGESIRIRDRPADVNPGRWRVVPAFWERAEWHWKIFGKKLLRILTSRGPEGREEVPYSWPDSKILPYRTLLELEAALNAPLTSPKANQRMIGDLSASASDGVNRLRLAETKRQVDIAYKIRDSGRIRLPHESHKNRICPYQTPESKEIGLHLFRCAGSVYDPEGESIRPGEFPYSLAVGLIPYLHHSDGPRLLMGGKNLKQAEQGIEALKGENPPAARVPGYLECFLESHRYKHTLGMDALVAIMPYEGYTYEDGLVVSSAFSEKLRIPDGTHTQTVVLRCNVPKTGGRQSTVEETQNGFENELKAYAGNVYSYDRELPLPLAIDAGRILDKENINIQAQGGRVRSDPAGVLPAGTSPAPLKPPLVPRYNYRYPGRLKDCKVTVVSGRPRIGSRGDGRGDDPGGTLLQLKIRYVFSVDRPLAVGDKLTGRHGNKGVVTRILEKPALAVIGGREVPVDLMISPGALMGRKNLGQLYEMTHSLLLWGQENGVFDGKEYSEAERKKLKAVSRNTLLSHEELAALLPLAGKMAGDESAKFEIEIKLPGGKGLEKPCRCRAFVGFQHIARLHHHVKAKLQYRGEKGPRNVLIGQPGAGGGSAGQRLGEMENWSCLSHPVIDGRNFFDSFDLLSAMRARHGDAEATKILARSLLRSLGYGVTGDAKIRRLDEASARENFPEASGGVPVEADLDWVRGKILERGREESIMAAAGGTKNIPQPLLCFTLRKNSPRSELGTLLESAAAKLASAGGQTEEQGKKAVKRLRSLFIAGEKEGELFLPAALDVLYQYKAVQDAFLEMHNQFSFFSVSPTGENARALQKAAAAYHDTLRAVLEGKMGLFRRHLLGRRLNHSGRAVIVPCPDLAIDRVRLPLPLFLGILTPETKTRLKAGRFPPNPSAAAIDRLNALLEDSPVWVILIRQPSLHRHNFTAFRASCWERDVIGIPPFATPGYNADFDGDTMAVFLPPEPYASNLSPMTLLSNPGLVGTGELALASGLDLALGWMNIFLKDKAAYGAWLEKAGLEAKSGSNGFVALGELLKGLFRVHGKRAPRADSENSENTLRDALLELQKTVCRESTGAATMTPVEFENLFREMKAHREKENPSFDEKKAEKKLAEWKDDDKNAANDLARFARYKVKGGEKELRVMTAFVGRQKYYEEEDTHDEKDMTERVIEKSFWEGLSDEDMFRYAHASRGAMASKKLDVAKAGYLSSLLAEGLFETEVTEECCSSKEYIRVYWENETLYLAFGGGGGTPVRFPLPGEANQKNLAEALGRIAWGRERGDSPAPGKLLNSEEIENIAASWLKKKAGTLSLRSPLTCGAGGRGVCAACAGADPASRPYDRPAPMARGSRVGLTAAQAIGERGTQLAMKRFHDTSSAGNKMSGEGKSKKETERERTSIEVLRSLLVQGRDDEGNKLDGENTNWERFRLLVEKVLTEPGKTVAFKELPQQLIHFELALKAPRGLKAWASETEGRWLSAFAQGGAKVLDEGGGNEAWGDEEWGLKSRLMWDVNGGRAGT